jgi:hypothetical protein
MKITDIAAGSKHVRVFATTLRAIAMSIVAIVVWLLYANTGEGASVVLPILITIILVSTIAMDIRLAIIRWRMR